MSNKRISVDLEKIKEIMKCPEPKTLLKACNFHGLVSLYRRFVKSFNTIIGLIIDCLKKG